jgi:hypothetical protein
MVPSAQSFNCSWLTPARYPLTAEVGPMPTNTDELGAIGVTRSRTVPKMSDGANGSDLLPRSILPLVSAYELAANEWVPLVR